MKFDHMMCEHFLPTYREEEKDEEWTKKDVEKHA